MRESRFQRGIKYEIFVGIKDKDSYQEILNVDSFKEILVEICAEKQISFSLLTQLGGFTHNKGYTTETSLRVIIIGISEEELMLLGMKLKEMVNTDTILITKTEIEYSFM
jgi:hypothetical protein